jgi:hypothetical protein
METKDLKVFLDRVRRWPKDAQDELVRAITEIESRYTNVYHLDKDERAALSRSADDVRNNRFATTEEFEAVYSRFHRT